MGFREIDWTELGWTGTSTEIAGSVRRRAYTSRLSMRDAGSYRTAWMAVDITAVRGTAAAGRRPSMDGQTVCTCACVTRSNRHLAECPILHIW